MCVYDPCEIDFAPYNFPSSCLNSLHCFEATAKVVTLESRLVDTQIYPNLDTRQADGPWVLWGHRGAISSIIHAEFSDLTPR